jgi:hypothetical protein
MLVPGLSWHCEIFAPNPGTCYPGLENNFGRGRWVRMKMQKRGLVVLFFVICVMASEGPPSDRTWGSPVQNDFVLSFVNARSR